VADLTRRAISFINELQTTAQRQFASSLSQLYCIEQIVSMSTISAHDLLMRHHRAIEFVRGLLRFLSFSETSMIGSQSFLDPSSNWILQEVNCSASGSCVMHLYLVHDRKRRCNHPSLAATMIDRAGIFASTLGSTKIVLHAQRKPSGRQSQRLVYVLGKDKVKKGTQRQQTLYQRTAT
jgi:hypothetical protein